MACIAIRVVWTLDAQYRWTVTPGTLSRPSSTVSTRAIP
jgi:hypothetical protein